MNASGSAVNQGKHVAQWAAGGIVDRSSWQVQNPGQIWGIVGEDKGLACGRGQLSISILQGKIAWLLLLRQRDVPGRDLKVGLKPMEARGGIRRSYPCCWTRH
jgi:hypothetical protein